MSFQRIAVRSRTECPEYELIGFLVEKRYFGFGENGCICAAASKPFSAGRPMPMSSRTKSGCNSLACSTAPAPFDALR